MKAPLIGLLSVAWCAPRFLAALRASSVLRAGPRGVDLLASSCRIPLASGRFFADGFFPLGDRLGLRTPYHASLRRSLLFRSTRWHGHFLLRRVEPVRHGTAGTNTSRPSLFASHMCAGTSPAMA